MRRWMVLMLVVLLGRVGQSQMALFDVPNHTLCTYALASADAGEASSRFSLDHEAGEETFRFSEGCNNFEETFRFSEGSNNSEETFRFSVPGIALSTSGMALGVATLQFPALHQGNIWVKEQVWGEGHGYCRVDNVGQFLPVGGMYLMKALGVPSRHDFWQMTERVATAYAAMMVINLTSKYLLVDELRPDGRAHNSFPSGHTATAFVGAELMRLEYKETAPWAGPVAYLVAGTTGFLRLYNNRHWATDVLAGAGLGFLSAHLTYALNERLFDGKKATTTDLSTTEYILWSFE